MRRSCAAAAATARSSVVQWEATPLTRPLGLCGFSAAGCPPVVVVAAYRVSSWDDGSAICTWP